MEKCKQGAKVIEESAEETIPDSGKMVNGERIYSEDISAFCRRFEVRPEVGTELKKDG